MKKIKKVVMFSLLMISMISVTALAKGKSWEKDDQDAMGGRHVYGVVQEGNGWTLGYSYYYHGTKMHEAEVYYDNELVAKAVGGPGQTAIAQGPSISSYPHADMRLRYNCR